MDVQLRLYDAVRRGDIDAVNNYVKHGSDLEFSDNVSINLVVFEIF